MMNVSDAGPLTGSLESRINLSPEEKWEEKRGEGRKEGAWLGLKDPFS